ncbi:DUF6924 domain-containing protein [Streptomyces aureocirculatus]|uniref:DUF6924 domain-containing protein n=1 Tax=Streptomyces aureocirculatus TaxID=67275 RepID=UPI0004CA1B6F
MPYPKLPRTAPGELPLISTCYEKGRAQWGRVLPALGGETRRVVMPPGSGIRLRVAKHPRWDSLPGGHMPALVQQQPAPPFAVLVDSACVYGGDGVLLVDLRHIPGRGVRVRIRQLRSVVESLAGGSLHFDDLVRGMDRFGFYQGANDQPAVATPTTVARTGFPHLPAVEETLLVRTDFSDAASWQAIVSFLDEASAAEGPAEDDTFSEAVDLIATVVDDRAFEDLQPPQVPALVPCRISARPTMVALADAVTMSGPERLLFVVDLYDTPGQAARIRLDEAGLMAVNLELSNMDFGDFV